MRRLPLKSTRRWQWLPRSPTLRLAGLLGSLLLCTVFWLGWHRELPMPSMPSRGQEIFRDPGFWEAAKYGIPSDLLPLLAKDQAANAAVALGPEGHEVPLSVALDQSNQWHAPGPSNTTQHHQSEGLLILVAITSTCCTVQAQHHRTAIRKSWGSTLASSALPIDLKFILAQPVSSAIAHAHDLLQDEVKHQDMVFVRNEEEYRNLPKKTISIMRYASLATSRYSHVLKTDDDCYVRVSKLVNLVRKLEREGEGMMYVGRQENPHGFFPIRDPKSKWYIPRQEMPDSVVPWKTRYLAGWGYLLSRDAVQLIVSKVDLYEQQPGQAPGWYSGLHWEDVLVGLLLHDYAEPQTRPDEFRAAWDSCSAGAVVKHMDVEALEVFPMLYAQEAQSGGAWAMQEVRCQVGGYTPGDYWSWKHWRDTLQDVLRV